ncbi:uncharacterized protein LOC114538464 [Dendronephthya gigantea]|uniref:uncharacterized protein LOC114538464 n=1 Tax=Dendronephthya gigantea TaxID=151771 RepID=UPI00106D3E75|nr:uncharacterized protein LOC114538464 [Dendronephthya gigantea]
MQCPLCRESVADENALQVHYLMSCLGYLDNASTNKQNEAPPSKKLVQFRWIKSKPTLAREVYLISSLAGSVKLDWRVIDECFLSDQVEVPQGLHVCQLVVDGDMMSTDDFSVSDTSRTIDVLISKDSPVDETTGNVSEEEHEMETTSNPGNVDEADGETEVPSTEAETNRKSSLYRELITHQILHGDSFETLTGTTRPDLGESSGSRKERSGSRKERSRGNGVSSRKTRAPIVRDTQDTSGIDAALIGSEETTRRNPDDSELPRERNNDAPYHSLSPEELQEFLQPTRPRQEISGGDDDSPSIVTEERESSLSDINGTEGNLLNLSQEDFDARPELLGQSNGENEGDHVRPGTVPHPDTSSDQGGEDDVVMTTREQSTVGERERSVRGREQPGRDREQSAGDRKPLVGERESLVGVREESVDDREESAGGREQEALPVERREPSSDRDRESLTSGRSEQSPNNDGREMSSGNRPKPLPRDRHVESSADDPGRVGDKREHSGSEDETSGENRKPSGDDRKASSGSLRTENQDPLLGHHELTSAGLLGRFSDGDRDRQFYSLPATTGISITRGQRLPHQSFPTYSNGTQGPDNTTPAGSHGLESDPITTTISDDLLFRNHSNKTHLRTNIGSFQDKDAPRRNTKPHDEALGGQRKHDESRDTNGSHSKSVRDSGSTAGRSIGRTIPPNHPGNEGRKSKPASREVSGQNWDIGSRNEDADVQSERSTLRSRHGNAKVQYIGSQNEEMRISSTDASTSSKMTRDVPRSSNISVGENFPEVSRHKPQGSYLTDGDVKRPPSYTTIPSRPYSSPPYTTSQTAISPLPSPRDDETAASSALGSGTSGVTVRETRVSSKSILNRDTPTGSSQKTDRTQASSGGSLTTADKKFTDDSIKELLESLKKETSKGKSSSKSPRDEVSSTSEIPTLKTRLTEQEELIKKLKAKRSDDKKVIEALREKEIQLTKALSLAEGNKKALKDQEEIASQLMDALGDKEKEYAELETQALDLKRQHKRLIGEIEEMKKKYEKKIHDLRSINVSLEDKIKSHHETSKPKSPRHTEEYKQLLESCMKSRAVAASLEDQVEALKKENKDLKDKLDLSREDISKRTRANYSSSPDRGMGTSREEQTSTSMNGYLDTNESSSFVGRQQFDSRHSPTDTRARAENDRYLSYASRYSPSDSRHPYDDHRTSYESRRHLPESANTRPTHSRPESESTRSHFETHQRSRSGRSRDRSDVHAYESPETSPRVEKHRSRQSRSRERSTMFDDLSPSEIAGVDFRTPYSRRSHSTDAIRNVHRDQDKISPSQERGSQELDRRSKDRSGLHRTGSSGNLRSSRFTSSDLTDDFTLTGEGLGSTPSPETASSRKSSPGKGTPFAPDSPRQLDVGMSVLVTRHRGKLSRGVVRYIGYLPEKLNKIYIGLELGDSDGKHDGKFNGQRFFKCKQNHGVFFF